MFKSALFFIALICLTAIIGYFASQKLSASIEDLHTATEKVSQGDFDVSVNIASKDEVGGLARSFNVMTAEIRRLLQETEEKVRMEGELKTAKLVQSTLFPPTVLSSEIMDIRGFYESASECGGDWWNYDLTERHVLLWIGDATGHGVPAALVTSAAKSASVILAKDKDIDTAKIMQFLNRSIYATAKGKVAMTFFLACLDKQTGELHYTNASHEPPYLIDKLGDKPFKKRHLQVLYENNGLRLGHQEETTYEVSKIGLKPGQRILFYTDGIIDLHNPEGQALSERQLIKYVVEAVNNQYNLKEFMEFLQKKIEDHRQGTELYDDLTYFMLEYKGAASNATT